MRSKNKSSEHDGITRHGRRTPYPKAYRNVFSCTYAAIEFEHSHTEFQNRPHIGESHNTIAVGVSPIDGTFHLLYDMHSYSAKRPQTAVSPTTTSDTKFPKKISQTYPTQISPSTYSNPKRKTQSAFQKEPIGQ